MKKAVETKKSTKPLKAKAERVNMDLIEGFGQNQPSPDEFMGPSVQEPEIPKKVKSPKIKSAKLASQESPILTRLGELSDDVIAKLDPAIQKLIANKYTGKIVKGAGKIAPIVPPAVGAMELYNMGENLEKGDTGSAMFNLAGAGSAAAAMAGAPMVAGGLGVVAATPLAYDLAKKITPNKYSPEQEQKIAKQFANKLASSPKLQKAIENKLGGEFYQGYKFQEKNPDYINHLKQSGLDDREILRQIRNYENQTEEQKNTGDFGSREAGPTKAEVVKYIIDKADEFGIDRSLALAQIEHESGGFKLGQVSKTGARGLSQMFPQAFDDAKSQDEFGDLQDLSYEDVFKNPANWKKQVDAGLLYNKAITKKYNKSGTDDEQLLRYHGGPSGTEETIGKASGDPRAHTKYLNSIYNKRQRWDQILNDPEQREQYLRQLSRSPAEVANYQLPSHLKPIKDYLMSPAEEEGRLMGKAITSGPFASGEHYGESIADRDRLEKLKADFLNKKYDKEFDEEDKVKLAKESEEEPTTEETDFSGDVNKLFDIEKGFTRNTVRDLASVQDTANKLRFLNTLQQSFDKIGGGIAGAMGGVVVKPGDKFTALSEQADALESQYKERAAKEADDPESQYSASLRNFAKPVLARMGIADADKLIDGMSGNQIAKILPQIKDMYEVEVRSKILKQQTDFRRKGQQDLADLRTYNQLPKALETIGGPAGNRLRARIQQAGNIYGTLGVNPKEFNKMSDDQIEDKLDEKTKLQIVESALEVNSLLSNSNSPAASTLNKLLMDSGYQRGMNALDFLANKQFARSQGKYLRQILNMTARVEKTALDELHNMKVRALSGYSRFADNPYIAGDFNNLLQQHGVSYDELQGKQKAEPAEKVSMSAKDKQAIQWAKQNLNNPNAEVSKKAKAIMNHFGM